MLRQSRPVRAALALAGILFLAAALPAHALKGLNADGSLDKPVISKAYFEGEFWTVINALEAFRQSKFPATRDDSVYTFKYLSVVYAADPGTRGKAESFMYQLIKMMPTIDLLDLYISDNIESIFQKVKSDFERLSQLRDTKAKNEQGGGKTAHGDSAAAASAPQDTSATVKAGAASVPPARASADRTAFSADPPPEGNPPAPQPERKSGMRIKPWIPFAIVGVGGMIATFVVLNLDHSSDGGSKTPRPVEVTVVTPNQGSE